MYMTLGQLTRSAQPSAESAVVASRLSHFTSEYMAEVGLDTWLQENGGMTAVLNEMVGLLLSAGLTQLLLWLIGDADKWRTSEYFTSRTVKRTSIYTRESAHDNIIMMMTLYNNDEVWG